MQSAARKGRVSVIFRVDKAASRFTVQAYATGILSAFGHNPRIELRAYDAEIQCPSETFENASLRVTVQMNSMEVLDEMKSGDRQKLEQEMYEKVLDSSRFPAAGYDSREITVQKMSNDLLRVQVFGDLSFHGTERPQTVQASVAVLGTNLRITGDFTLRQSDYGIKPVSFAAGALRLKDELKFAFDLMARKSE